MLRIEFRKNQMNKSNGKIKYEILNFSKTVGFRSKFREIQILS